MRRLLFVLSALLLLSLFALSSAAQTQTSQPQNLFQLFVQSLRSDIEALANRAFGAGERPEGWTGNLDFAGPSTIADLYFDSEMLADEVFGTGRRPLDWIGATTTNAELVTRNLRRDLERMADEVLGEGRRPSDWVGASKLFTCDRTLMNIVYLLEQRFQIRPTTSENVSNYCASLAFEVEDEIAGSIVGTQATEQLSALILAVRGDLERTADEKLGLGNRPQGWLGNKDIRSPSLAGDIFFDQVLLADEIFGRNTRPPEWIGAVSSSPFITFRNLRFDLELMTDTALGEGVRPRGWQGTDPLLRCEATTQTLVLLASQSFGFNFQTSSTGDDYCREIARAANEIVENPPDAELVGQSSEDDRFKGRSQYAFAYLDVAALQYMGVMPGGVEFRAWYRNFGNSNMMFVSGQDFALFIDRRWTTMPEEVFRSLPTLEGVRPLTFCDARWCNGPAPTPTPTGSGPLLSIIVQATPAATRAPSELQQGGKTQVSWNNIRINYLLQKPDQRVAQVTLEICREVAQINCEGVVSIFNNTTGQLIPPVQTFNGLNVYELPYGYTTNLLIEGTTLFSTDVWLNDPTLTGGN